MLRAMAPLIGALGLALSAASLPAHAVTRSEYDALIIQARNGQYEPALEMLRAQAVQYPNDLRAAFDRMLIASWARLPREIIAAYEGLRPTPNHPPADVLGVVAGAYRDTQQWDNALRLYRDGRRLYPRNIAFAVGEVKVLSDAGRTSEAAAAGKAAAARWPDDPDIELAQAYAMRAGKSPDSVLEHATRAAALAPGKRYVTSEYIQSLRDAGLPGPALAFAEQNPDAVDAAALRRIQADRAAELTRLAGMPSTTEAERFALADQAIALYDTLIPQWEALGEPARADVDRLRSDRIHALRARARPEQVIAQYRQIKDSGRPVPAHVLGDVADAYLVMRQPEEAAEMYIRLLNGENAPRPGAPERVSSQTSLFYAMQELGRYDEARELIEQTIKEQPQWTRIKGQPVRQPNELYLYAAHTDAIGRLYSQDTVGAEERVRKLLQTAPNNSTLRTDLAEVLLAREQPRAAERELKTAEAMTPRSIQLEIDQANTAMALQEWKQAQLLVADVTQRFPEHKDVRRLARTWEVHNMRELRVSANRSISSNSPVSGSGDMSIDTVLYTAPIDDNWRGFAGIGYAQGKFEEGNANNRWMRGGVEWRGRDLTIQAEASASSYGDGVKPGISASADYELDDHWQIGATGELRSRNTPLRALNQGITSNRAEFRLGWKANERRAWQLALAPTRFSDGNTRLEATLRGRERLYTSPRLKADLEIELSASHNSREGGPYFNPRSDLMFLPSIALTHTLYQRYDTSVEQRLTLGAGVYKQRDFSSGAVAAIGYGLRYRANQVLDIGASVTAISRPYDGVREREVRVMLDMNLRF